MVFHTKAAVHDGADFHHGKTDSANAVVAVAGRFHVEDNIAFQGVLLPSFRLWTYYTSCLW